MTTIEQVDAESLRHAARIIHDGGVVVVPTDTVYGVACDPSNTDAIARIYAIKHRPRSKALQVLLSDVAQTQSLGLVLPAPLDVLSEAMLPGAFSPIALALPGCTLVTLHPEDDGGSTQAIRVPDSKVSLKIIEATGPLAATSANRSGNQSASTVDEAYAELGDAVDLYLDGGPTVSHVASTVVRADPQDPDGVCILREGVISEAAVRSAVRSAVHATHSNADRNGRAA